MAAWPEPGWYYEPGGPQVARWWDGVAWGPYTPPSAFPPQPAIDRFGLPMDHVAPQQTALLDPIDQVWLAPGGGTTTPAKSQTGPIWLIVVVILLVLFVPAIDVVWRQHHREQAAALGAGQNPLGNEQPTNPERIPTATPGHPVFVVMPKAAPGFTGLRKVVYASGFGSMTTGTFKLTAGRLTGDVTQAGRGASFVLESVGDDGTAIPVATCANGCAEAGWSFPDSHPAGKYRLRVTASSDTRWTFDLTEAVAETFWMSVSHNSGGTQVTAQGLASQHSTTFPVSGKFAADGTLPLSGSFSAEQDAVITIVGTGETQDPHVVLTHTVAAGSGGLGFRLPGAGPYTLVVETKGAWHVDLATQ